MPPTGDRATIDALHTRRTSRSWAGRIRRWLEPPRPYVMNPREPKDFPLGRWNLYIGGAAARPDGYVNIDLFPMPGVDVACDAECLPFPAGTFTRVECDAVLEHVACPDAVMREIERILAPGGYVHVVTPFCHPFHEYPRDYRRFTPDGLKQIAGGLEPVAEGWRTGPTATLLVFTLEWAKLLLPWRIWRAAVHFTLGWLIWPLRYLDAPLLNTPAAARIGNHCYVWFRKPAR